MFNVFGYDLFVSKAGGRAVYNLTANIIDDNCQQVSRTERCCICESQKIRFYKKAHDFFIYKCEECKLLWIKGIANQDIASFYGQSYFESDSLIGYKNYLADEKNHRKNARTIIKEVSKIKDLTNLRILDLGCAFGFLLDEAKKTKNCAIYGIEISQYAYEYTKKYLGANIYNCEITSCHFEPNFFDVVFLIGTVEHLISPKDVLNNLGKTLKPGGLLVITTLDTNGLIPLYSLKVPEHPFYFNHNNLSLLLSKLGYKTVLRKTYFANYHLYDLFHRLDEFLSLRFLGSFSWLTEKIFPNFSVKIPTNEMIIIARKDSI